MEAVRVSNGGPDDIRPLHTATARLLLVLLLLIATAARAEDSRAAPAVGQHVRAFELFDSSRVIHRLSDCREPVIVLNFWAFWCDTWKAQLPQLLELSRQQEELNFRLLVISVDGQWSDNQRQYLRQHKLPFPVLLDGQKRVATALGVRRVPTVMVLDQERRVRWVHEAYPGNPVVLRAVRGAL